MRLSFNILAVFLLMAVYSSMLAKPPSGEPDLSMDGWISNLKIYNETREVDAAYEMDTLAESYELFVENITSGNHSRTVHWDGVRLVWEVMQATLIYYSTDRR